MKTFKQLLINLDACEPAREWAGDMTIEEVVEKCHRGDWLLWLAYKLYIGLQPLTLAKGHCANTVRHFMKDERSIKAVDIAIAFGEGKATREELDAVADAAADAASSVAAADAVAAVAAAAVAASSVAAAAVAAAAADAAAGNNNRIKTADICRKYIGQLIINKVKKEIEKL